MAIGGGITQSAPYVLGFWGDFLISFVVASAGTFVAGRAYLGRQSQFRFGVAGTTILFVVIWSVLFAAVFALGTNSWANIA